MNVKSIPRKHRKHVRRLIGSYKDNLGYVDHMFKNWDEFLRFNLNGADDGWLETTDGEYQALLWLIDVTNAINELNDFNVEED